MKKLVGFRRAIAAISLVILFTHGLRAENTMQMGSASMGPNQSFSIQVDINNSNAFVAFQFDLPIPGGFTYVTGSALLNPVRANGHIIQASIIPGNMLRVLGFSFNNTPFIGASGSVVSFQMTSGTIPGAYPLTLINPVIGNANSVNILTGSTDGTVNVLAPDIDIPVTLIDFIRTPLGSATDMTLTIYNTGNQPLDVTGISFTSSCFSVVGSSIFSIPAGQDYNLMVRFTALVKGIYDKKITIITNDPDEGTQQVSLHARAYAVNELHTGNMFAWSGHQGTLTFSINNMEPFTGFQFDLVLPAPLTYVSNSASLTNRKTNHVVSANTISGNRLRVVAYSPTGQVFNGVDGDVLSLTFDVDGIGGYFELNLQDVIIGDTLAQNAISDSFNGTLLIAASDVFSNTQVDFGNVSVLETGHQTLRIYNYGTDTLKVDHITFTNPSYATGAALPFHVLVNQYKDIIIDFHQAIKGQSNGIMKIFSNDPDEYPYNVNLTAFAYIPNYITIPNLSARYIDTLIVPVKITNMEAVVGFQFDIEIPSWMSYVQNSATLTARAPGYILQADNITETIIRVIAFSLSQTPLTGDTGTVVNLKFNIRATNNQTSATLMLSDGVLGNVSSQNVLWGMINGNVSIAMLPATVNITGNVIPGQPECHNATQVITVAGNGSTFIVPNGASATMIAGQKIIYRPGTIVNSGGYMHGAITTTGQYCGMKAPVFDSVRSYGDKNTSNSEQSFFKIYPNPTTGNFILELKEETLPVTIRVEIYGSQGEKVFTKVLYGERRHEFTLSNVPAGVYFIRVISGFKTEAVKIIKQ